MTEVVNIAIAKLEDHWHRFYTPIILAVVTDLLVLYQSTDKPIWCIALILTGIPILLFIVWHITNKIPTVKPNRIGIVLAFSSDSKEEAHQLQIDFITTLRKLLLRDPDGGNFDVVVLPDHVALQLVSRESCEMVLNKCKGHLLLFGTAKKRNVNGQASHMLTFEGFVRHAPVPKEIGALFEEDFRSAIPLQMTFSTENDALIFETASKWFEISTRYVVAVAAYLSGAVSYAENLLLMIEADLQAISDRPPFLNTVAKKLPARFIELYTNWNGFIHNEYYISGKLEYLEMEDSLTGKLLQRDPSNYHALLGKSITEFKLHRNTAKAKELLSKCGDIPEATWRYNLAFLYCYEGNLQAAHDEYRLAFKNVANSPTTLIQCEEFIHKVLIDEPDKTQLFFAMGLINYNTKKDYTSAKKDFESFLGSTWATQYPNEAELCRKLILRCDSNIIRNK